MLSISDDHKKVTFDNGIVIGIRDNKGRYELYGYHISRPDHTEPYGTFPTEEDAIKAMERVYVGMLDYRRFRGGDSDN